MILALDSATTCGWAAGEPGGAPVWGSRKFEGKATGQVIGMFRHWLNHLCYEHHPTLICFESPYVPRGASKIPMNPLTLRRLLGMAAMTEAVAWELRIRCNEATTLDVARFFIGTQRLKRDEKKLRTIEMCRRYGWDVSNDNEADALALWHYAESNVAPDIGLRRGAGPLFIPENRTPPDPSRSEASLFPPPEGGASDGRVAR